MDLDQRKKDILFYSIQEYVKTATPIASAQVAQFFGLSSATLRNEMSALEKMGYMAQPHVSAGRIPTEKAYKLYVAETMREREYDLAEDKKRELEIAIQQSMTEYHRMIKSLAKVMADLTQQTVIVAFTDSDVFYTGISHLFRKPEFLAVESLADLSVVIDHMGDAVHTIYDSITVDISVMIGSDNPFDNQCSSLLTRYESEQLPDGSGVMGILGPMRMPYEMNQALLSYAKSLLENTK